MNSQANLLVDTSWLADRIADPKVRIIDMRGAVKPIAAPQPWYRACHDEYAAAHIPGAVFVDWLEDIVTPEQPDGVTVNAPERMRALMERLGIGDTHSIVIYDDDGGHIAARLWWELQYFGHQAVALLDGGYSKWVAEGRPVNAERPSYPPVKFTPRPQPTWRATIDEARRASREHTAVLLDCRGPGMYKGLETRGERPGRIPGAVNLPAGQFVEGPYKTFKSQDELRKMLASVGATPHNEVITYCTAGVSSATGLFALRLANQPRSRLFDGSWREWSRDPVNPVELG